ncbi:MAG: cyclic nucleotide-binding domain-containing protein [Bacteroidota bacterium]
MENLKSILSQHPFFKDFSEDHLTLITGCASNVRFDAGDYIFREGEEAHQFYLIRQGRVGIEILSPDRGPITIQTVSEGDILGWSWLIPPYEWHFDARVVELTRAMALDAKCLRTKCETDHHLGYELLKRFSGVMEQRLQATIMQLLDLYGLRV